MTVVTFTTDIFPHVKGSVVNLDDAEKARVDEQVKLRNLDRAYVAGDRSETDGGTPQEVQAARADREREAARTNAIDQAAQLEAQRSAVAEPANVEALGVVAETDQVVTGNKPVEDVAVENPQEATDIASGEGAKVKGKK